MSFIRVFLLLASLALAAGCAGLPLERRPSSGTAEAAQRPVAESRSPGLPGAEAPAGVPGVQSGAPGARANPAVVALRDTAAEKSRAGRPGEAAAALERALRIDPANPDLWARLAEVRLAQGEPRQAESLALKALELSAPGQPLFAARCQRLVAKARRAQGDEAGARAAEVRARELEAR